MMVSQKQATAAQRPNSLVGLSSLLEKVDSIDSPQPPPSTPTRSQSPLLGSPTPVSPRAVYSSLAKSPDNFSVKKQPSNSEKPKSPKGLRLPKLAASSNATGADAAQETLENEVILPKLK